MDYFEVMSHEDYVAFVRRGGVYLFYEDRRQKNRFVFLGPSCELGTAEDWEVKRALVMEYNRLLATTLKNGRSKSPQARAQIQARVNDIWDRSTLYEWRPDPDYDGKFEGVVSNAVSQPE
jgi:hypothetical protein